MNKNYSVDDKEFGANHNDEHEWILQENAELKEALKKATGFKNALKHRYEVSKENLKEIMESLKNCRNKCYLTFNDSGILTTIESDL